MLDKEENCIAWVTGFLLVVTITAVLWALFG
jgi:hypothetical protein